MKFHPVSLLVLALALPLAAAEPPPGVPAVTNIPGAPYPRILPDNRVVLRVKAPEAKIVQFQTDKAYEAVRDAEGNWSATTDPQAPGFHYYWLVIDGVRVNDPASETFYGTSKQTSGLEIPEPGHEGDYYQVRDVPHGEVRERAYHSALTGESRRFFLYTPPGYDQARDTRYPVLYLQHGGGEDERAWPIQGRVSQIMDNLVADGKTRPMLIVMERGYARRPGDTQPPPRLVPPKLFDSAPRTPAEPPAQRLPADFERAFQAFEDVLTQELVPFIDANYRTLADREHRAIAGFSMGGMQATLFGLKHPDLFSALAGFSGAAGGFDDGHVDPKTFLGGVLADAGKFKQHTRLVYIGLGTTEPPRIFSAVHDFHESLSAAGIEHVYFESVGTGHEWLTERRNLRELVPRLFR